MSTRCARCGGESEPQGHSLSLDGARKLWRLCCACTDALIARLDGA